MDFRSDNVAGAHPAIIAALSAAAHGTSSSYGADPWTERLERRCSELFEREVAVLPVATGTAANALALALYTPPWGAVYCHEQAHVNVDECGAPEAFTSGAKLLALPGQHGKFDATTLERAIHSIGVIHAVQPAAVTISQSTEAGTLYRPEEIRSIAQVARKHQLALHMDGARFANALVALNATPAALTWQAGVDVLSFGATKNGCFAAEAIILFDRAKAQELAFRRKRSGHLLSKGRFLSAQLEAYLENDLWLTNARHANAQAAALARGFEAVDFRLLAPVEANELFVDIPDLRANALRARGFAFLDWPLLGPNARRFVTSFDTQSESVDALLSSIMATARR